MGWLIPVNYEFAPGSLTWECCLVYVDGILVFGATFDEHAARLEQVFQRLATAGLKLKPSKCRLFHKRVTFLGHVVSKDGVDAVEPDQSKISAVVDWPVPRDVSEARLFIGICSYYRAFVPNFSSVPAPLFALTKNEVPFVWYEKCQEAFDTLKLRLTTAPALATLEMGEGMSLTVIAASMR